MKSPLNLISTLPFYVWPACFLFAGVIFLAGCQPSDQTIDFAKGQTANQGTTSSGIPLPQNSDVMPQFTLPTLEGGSFDSSEHEGRVLLVNFWATWCAPCRTEIPDLIALQRELGSDDFEVIGISLDADEPAYVKEFVDAMEINYAVLLDDGEVAEAFGGVYALPTTFVIDKKGKITHRTIGLFPVETVKDELALMIAAE